MFCFSDIGGHSGTNKENLFSYIFFFLRMFGGALSVIPSINTARYKHASATLPGDIVWVLGGWGGDRPVNDVWKSVDRGVSWTMITSNAGWLGNVELYS